MLELKYINKIYRSNQTKAIVDINISFRKKEFVAVVGPSGCGKTTLLNIIGGIDKYSSGELLINNKTTSKYKEKDWDKYRNKSIGFVFQNYNLIPYLTVYENIETAIILSGYNKKQRKKLVEQAIQKVSLTDVKNSLPNQLSGGQMQRVAIARAIIKNPDVILADEPTGALDSKTAIQIIEVLKEIAKEKLVIMVTHNEQIAKMYATREIRLLDGYVVSDSNPYEIIEINEDQAEEKKHMIGLLASLKLSAKSLKTKLIRTLLIVIAGSVGIIGVTLILTISSGIDKYIFEFQRVTLADAPIIINTTYDYTDPYEDDHNYEEFPDNDTINVVINRDYYSHLNIFSEDFINYVNNLDQDYYKLIDYSRSLNMKIFIEREEKRKWISTSVFTELNTMDFARDQYTLLSGQMPTKVNELVLLVDKYNNLSAQVVEDLGLDYESESSYQFDDLVGMKYQLTLNDEYYYKSVSDLYSTKYSLIDSINIEQTMDLEIVGIIRPNKNAELNLYSQGILYTPALGDYVVEDSQNSEIVIEQMEYGLSKDVFTGKPFEDHITAGARFTKEYLYESQLVNLCYKSRVNNIRIYTDKFNSRILINEYLSEYNNIVPDANKIRFSDRFGSIVNEFNSFVQVLTQVLIVFSLISLFVSSIMITIITYVSVIERMNEIGILRSLGASRFDIANVFNAETAIIGFLSGVMGVLISILLMNPILNMITNILQNNNIKIFNLTDMNISLANPLFMISIILGSVVLTVIAGLVPAIIAARKSPVDAIRIK